MLHKKYLDRKYILYHQTRLISNDDYWNSKNPCTLSKIKDLVINSNKKNFITEEIWEEVVNISNISKRSNRINFHVYNNFLTTTDDEQITWPSKYLAQIPRVDKEITAVQRGQKLLDKALKPVAEWVINNLNSDSSESDIEEYMKKIKEIFILDIERRISNAAIDESPSVTDENVEYTERDNSTSSIDIEPKIKCHFEYPNFLANDSVYTPYDCKSMKSIWNGIENLKITKDFYKWLMLNKHNVPPYLESYYKETTSKIDAAGRKIKKSQTWLPIVKKLDRADINALRK